MIRQYLSNKNESATVAKSEIFSELNKALVYVLVEILDVDRIKHGVLLSATRLERDDENL